MYFLELPYCKPNSGIGIPTSGGMAPGSPTSCRRGWYVRLDYASIGRLSAPQAIHPNIQGTEIDGGRRCLSGNEMVLHSRTGSCLWLHCADGGTRDSLVDVICARHRAGSADASLAVARTAVKEVASSARCGGKGPLASLLTERQACTWSDL